MKNQEREELKAIFNYLKDGNKEAIENLYKKYNKMIYGIAFSILKNKDDSDDIVQTVFSKLYTIDKYKMPKEKEATWLYTVTKNEALLFLRNKNDTYDLEQVYNVENENNEINELIDMENYNHLINKLDSKEKEIVSLKVISNFSFKQISELLGEPIGTVKWRYYKSIYALRIMLSNLGMSIISFVLGIVSFKQTSKIPNGVINQEEMQDKNENEKEESINDNFKEENINNSLKDEQEMNKIEKEENDVIKTDEEIKENTTTQESIVENNVNYLGYGIMSISAIFLTLAIIFAIILKKHQLKLRKKSSK